MFFLSQTLIVAGLSLMFVNVYRYIGYLKNRKEVSLEQNVGNRVLDYVIFVLILSFAVVYAIILSLSIHSIWIGIILSSGSLFVFLVLTWIFQLIESLKNSSFTISETLIGVLEARDPNLDGHSLHVQDLTMLIYDELPLDIRRKINRENLKYASLFHDVGKLGIPEAILNKPGKLNEEEWAIMRQHADISVKLLKPMKSFDSISNWILFHHERCDGHGYHNIPGDEIPVESRIIAVADTFSAITMSRSYKPARSYEEGVEILKEVSGTQLDPKIVDAFLHIPENEVKECTNKVKERMERAFRQNHGIT
ncbi:MAG: HD domain-containing protein [Lachnospiraceae bacterium]|nr:HD domain-containing protein [Lachnospiraceae bacterium]